MDGLVDANTVSESMNLNRPSERETLILVGCKLMV